MGKISCNEEISSITLHSENKKWAPLPSTAKISSIKKHYTYRKVCEDQIQHFK